MFNKSAFKGFAIGALAAAVVVLGAWPVLANNGDQLLPASYELDRMPGRGDGLGTDEGGEIGAAGGDVWVDLYRVRNLTGAEDTMASVSTTGFANSTSIRYLGDITVDEPAVSDLYSYYVFTCFPSDGGIDLRLYAVRIFYSTSTVVGQAFGGRPPLVIPAAAFTSHGENVEDYFFSSQVSGFFGYIRQDGTGSVCLQAPAYLPAGATVTSVYGYLYDNHSGEPVYLPIILIDSKY